MMYKKEKVFLMPYEYCFADYSSAIFNNNLPSLTRLFYDIEIINVDKKPCKLSRKEIVDLIKIYKENLANDFGIEKLYLFGSYAKGKNTNRSDVDLAVSFNNNLINMEKKENIEKLKTFFGEQFDSEVDVLERQKSDIILND